MNRSLAPLALTVLLAAAALGQDGQSAQNAGQRAAAQHAQAPQTIRILYQRIPDVRFQDTPFEQVMEWLADLTQLNLSVRWQVLKDAGISRDAPISIQARNLRLTQVLWLIMNEAGGSDVKLAYRASGNLLVLSTADDLNKEMITKIYDVSDLLINLPQASRQNSFDVTQGLGQNTSGGGGGGSSGMFGGGQGQQQTGGYDSTGQGQQGEQQMMQQLVDLIQSTIEPDSWRQNGGQGTIQPFHRALVVRNTILVHQRLGGYVTEEEAAGQ